MLRREIKFVSCVVIVVVLMSFTFEYKGRALPILRLTASRRRALGKRERTPPASG